MSEEKKHWSEKNCNEMSFEEFVRWAEEYAMNEFLTDGLKGMKRAIWNIVDQSARNEVFGSGFPRKNKK